MAVSDPRRNPAAGPGRPPGAREPTGKDHPVIPLRFLIVRLLFRVRLTNLGVRLYPTASDWMPTLAHWEPPRAEVAEALARGNPRSYT